VFCLFVYLLYLLKVFSLPSTYWLELADFWTCGNCCAFRQFPTGTHTFPFLPLCRVCRAFVSCVSCLVVSCVSCVLGAQELAPRR
jgi:hypothetical protein